jgi:hypothetical protein
LQAQRDASQNRLFARGPKEHGMATRVISFMADADARASFDNHRRYCAARAYRHDYVDASAPGWPHLRLLLKYQTLLRALREAPDGDLVLLLTQDCLILCDIACETLIDDSGRDSGHDWLVVADSHEVFGAFQLWRNTAAAREQVQRICGGTKFGGALNSESDLLRPLDPRHFTTKIGDYHAVLPAALHVDPKWAEWPVFAAVLGDIPDAPANQPVHADFRDLIATHVNDCQANAQPYLTLPPPPGYDAAYEGLHRHAPIAIAMLYTPNIRAYGGIAESNLRRYCARHGYALHLYRDVPAEAGPGATGNWLKPWVLLRHLDQHEWIVWIDADVLVVDQSQPLEPLLAGRDRIVATDMSWRFNSGIMGFRNTDENRAVLTEIEQAIGGIEDKSNTYASGGDQDVFIKVLDRHGMAHDHDLLDCTTLNTPYQLQGASSFMVHYMHMWPSLRALVMHHGDLASQMRDRRRI